MRTRISYRLLHLCGVWGEGAMSLFSLPQQPIIQPTPAPDLEKLVRESVQRFTRELGGFVMLAKQNGWIEKYETEVRRVAESAWKEARG